MKYTAAALNKAIGKLKADGIIKRDAEIATAMEYSKGTLSEYISGKKPISYAFAKKFEDAYKLDLSNFEEKNIKLIKEKDKGDTIQVTGDIRIILAQQTEQIAVLKASIKVLLLRIAELESKKKSSSYSKEHADLEKAIEEQYSRDVSGTQKLFS